MHIKDMIIIFPVFYVKYHKLVEYLKVFYGKKETHAAFNVKTETDYYQLITDPNIQGVRNVLRWFNMKTDDYNPLTCWMSSVLELSIIIFWDIKMKTWNWSANSIVSAWSDCTDVQTGTRLLILVAKTNYFWFQQDMG